MSICVVNNKVPITKGYEDAFEEIYHKRSGLVDKEPGFLRIEIHRPHPMDMDMDMEAKGIVLSPDDDEQNYYLIKTWWRDYSDFVAWTNSKAFAKTHQGSAGPVEMPDEMFAGENVVEVHEVIISTDLKVN